VSGPAVLLLEAAGPESGALAKAAVARGRAVHAATTPAGYAAYSAELTGLLAGRVLTDLARPERAAQEITAYARRRGIGAVLTVNEYLTELAALVCATLGLPGNDPDLAKAARNKAAMAAAFARGGVTMPRTHIVKDEHELLQLCAAGQITFPCVIKPADGAGSTGVTVVTSAKDAPLAWQAARAGTLMYGMPRDARVLLQEYVEGAEFSVESLTQNGHSTHLCTTRKTVTMGTYRVETGHSLPAALPPETERAVHQEVERAITAVGIRNGASHTEVMLTPAGRCVVIEIGARLGAGQIGFLIQHALGIDPWTALLDAALGRQADLAPTRQEHATIRFLTSPATGRLTAVSGLPEPGPSAPAVRLRTAIGNLVTGTRGNGQRLGSFVVTGPDARTVEERADTLLRQVRIEVEPQPEPPTAGQVTASSTLPSET